MTPTPHGSILHAATPSQMPYNAKIMFSKNVVNQIQIPYKATKLYRSVLNVRLDTRIASFKIRPPTPKEHTYPCVHKYIYIYILESSSRASRGLDSFWIQNLGPVLVPIRACRDLRWSRHVLCPIKETIRRNYLSDVVEIGVAQLCSTPPRSTSHCAWTCTHIYIYILYKGETKQEQQGQQTTTHTHTHTHTHSGVGGGGGGGN
jgi:hypothetical protein